MRINQQNGLGGLRPHDLATASGSTPEEARQELDRLVQSGQARLDPSGYVLIEPSRQEEPSDVDEVLDVGYAPGEMGPYPGEDQLLPPENSPVLNQGDWVEGGGVFVGRTPQGEPVISWSSDEDEFNRLRDEFNGNYGVPPNYTEEEQNSFVYGGQQAAQPTTQQSVQSDLQSLTTDWINSLPPHTILNNAIVADFARQNNLDRNEVREHLNDLLDNGQINLDYNGAYRTNRPSSSAQTAQSAQQPSGQRGWTPDHEDAFANLINSLSPGTEVNANQVRDFANQNNTTVSDVIYHMNGLASQGDLVYDASNDEYTIPGTAPQSSQPMSADDAAGVFGLPGDQIQHLIDNGLIAANGSGYSLVGQTNPPATVTLWQPQTAQEALDVLVQNPRVPRSTIDSIRNALSSTDPNIGPGSDYFDNYMDSLWNFGVDPGDVTTIRRLATSGQAQQSPVSPQAATVQTPQDVEVGQPGTGKAKVKLINGVNKKDFEDTLKNLMPHKNNLDEAAQEIPAMLGAPSNSEVHVKWVYGGDMQVEIQHPYFEHAERTLRTNPDGTKSIYVNLTRMSAQAPPGFGAEYYVEQVKNSAANGFDYIENHSAGSGSSLAGGWGTYNGYYTWACFGKDCPLSDLDTMTAQLAKKTFPTAQSVSDIIETPVVQQTAQEEKRTRDILAQIDANNTRRKGKAKDRPVITGKDWWLAHGSDMMHARFDLKEGSSSRRILENYVAEQNARKGKTNV